VYDTTDELRTETSCGYGFKKKRKALARENPQDIKNFLNTFDCSFDVLFTLFLKEEMREIELETRSVAVPQLHLMLIFRKYLGWLYKYFERGIHPFAYNHTPTEGFFTEKFSEFDIDVETISIDFKKMDARMNTIFIDWFERFILTQTNFPVEHTDVLTWIHDQSFFNKRVLDPYGNVITFSNGEMSGFPGTILYNSLYGLWTMCAAQIVNDQLAGMKHSVETMPLLILGDDIIFQQQSLEITDEVVQLLGHELYVQKGSLINDVTFLSYKFHSHGGLIRPYYANLDKMFASLRYYKNDITYFQKLASFHSLLAFSPSGSLEAEWRDKIESILIQKIRLQPAYYQSVINSYRPTKVWKNMRSYYTPSILPASESLADILNL